MTQADSVHSTPPTNSPKIKPVDQARRHLLTVAAGGTIAALANVTGTAATVLAPDPIFAAIEAHRAAYATMMAVFAEHRRVHALADATVGPFQIEVPSMVEPGETVWASCWWDIEGRSREGNTLTCTSAIATSWRSAGRHGRRSSSR